MAPYAVCENLLWDQEVFAFTHTSGFQDSRLCQELGGRFSCYNKSLKLHKRVCLCLLGIQEKISPWTRSYHVVMVVSFLLEVVIEC